MKIRAKANGDIIEVDEEAAKGLIEAGIYEAVDEEPPVVLTKMVTPRTARRQRR
jgi:hypothetical protein